MRTLFAVAAFVLASAAIVAPLATLNSTTTAQPNHWVAMHSATAAEAQPESYWVAIIGNPMTPQILPVADEARCLALKKIYFKEIMQHDNVLCFNTGKVPAVTVRSP